jgi:tRNA(Ile2) C34 agmatinyltransferase TiaS
MSGVKVLIQACSRCGSDAFRDSEGSGWRCLNCRRVIDSVSAERLSVQSWARLSGGIW